MSKFIYLDQNKWIDLARSLKGKDSKFDKVRELIEEKVKNDEWIFPISIIHIIETSSRLDDRTRNDLVDTFEMFYNNYSILPYIYCEMFEIDNILKNLMKLETIDLNEVVIQNNSLNSVGLKQNPKYDSYFSETIKNNLNIIEKISFINILRKKIDINELNEIEKDNLEYKSGLETIRDKINKYPKQYAYQIFLVESFFERFSKSLVLFANKHNLKKEAYDTLINFNDQKCVLGFLESCSSFHAKTSLIYSISKDQYRDIDKNDFKDIAALSTALPYCDVVVTEKLWWHHVKSQKLDEKYNSIIFRDLNSLLNL
jgi:hypothetical protein